MSIVGWVARFLALFFFLYGVKFVLLPLHTSRIALLFVLAYMLVTIQFRVKDKIDRIILVVFSTYFLLFSWVFYQASLSAFADTELLKAVVIMGVQGLLGAFLFSRLLINSGQNFSGSLSLVHFCIFVQAVFIVLGFISWEFRNWGLENIEVTGNIDPTKNLFRSRGLMNSSGAYLSVMQSIGLFLTAYLISKVRVKSVKFWFYSLSFGVIAFSIFLTGRTGILVLPIIVLYFLILMILKLRIQVSVVTFVVALPVVMVGCFFLLKLGYELILGGFTMPWGEDGFDRLIRWVVSEFWGRDGSVRLETAGKLYSHIKLPETWQVFLFGDLTTWSLNRISSDIGLIRLLFASGLVGVLIFYFMFILLTVEIVRRVANFEDRLFVGLLMFFLLVLELKEPFLLNVYIHSLFFLIIFLIGSHSKKTRNVPIQYKQCVDT